MARSRRTYRAAAVQRINVRASLRCVLFRQLIESHNRRGVIWLQVVVYVRWAADRWWKFMHMYACRGVAS